jgi:hypothetical protein
MRPDNPEQLHKILERVCILLEEELGGDVRSWLATCLVLLQTITDAAEMDINDVAAMLIKCHRPSPDDIPPIH